MSCTVKLRVRASTTAWGETIAVAGSHASLSSWAAERAPHALEADPFPVWTTTLTLPADTEMEYKYVVMRGDEIARWESLPKDANRSLRTPPSDQLLTIDDAALDDPAQQLAVTPPPSPARSDHAIRGRVDERVSTARQDDGQHDGQHGSRQDESVKHGESKDERQAEKDVLDKDAPGYVGRLKARVDSSREQIDRMWRTVRRLRGQSVAESETEEVNEDTKGVEREEIEEAETAEKLASRALSEAAHDVDVLRAQLQASRKGTRESKQARNRTGMDDAQAATIGIATGVSFAILGVVVLMLAVWRRSDDQVVDHARLMLQRWRSCLPESLHDLADVPLRVGARAKQIASRALAAVRRFDRRMFAL